MRCLRHLFFIILVSIKIINTQITKHIQKYIALLALLVLCIDSFAYRLKDGDVTVVNGIIVSCTYDISSKGNVIEIPDVLDGQTITGIGDYAFQVAGKIAELTLPSTLETIGNGVFEGHALTSLEIPNGVTSIGYAAFADNALSSINLPSGLLSIGDRAFGNNQLSTILLPSGLTTVGNRAFQNNLITSLTIPNNIVTIGWSAFLNNQITSLTIPNNVESIGNSAFANNSISTLIFQSGSKLTEISGSCFSNNNIRNVTIPNSVLVIYEHAFDGNVNLNGVTLSSNLLRIRQGAFSSCDLSSVNLPASLVFIGKYAFGNNPQINSLKLPSSAESYTWNDSNGDKHNAGDVVTDLYYSYVARIPYELQPEDIIIQDGIIIECSYYNDITNLGSVITIPSSIDGENVLGIGDGVFSNRGISEINLPGGLLSIGRYAFNGNEIINLIIPSSVEIIGEGAFNYNCINSLSFNPTSKLSIIGKEAFRSNRIISIDFPLSVSKIGKFAFANNWLENVSFEDNSKLVSIGSYAFVGNHETLSLTLPDPTANGYDFWIDWASTEYSSNLVVNSFESFYKIPIEYVLTDDDVEVVDGVIVSYMLNNPYGNILTIPETLDDQKIIGIGSNVFQEMGLIGINFPPTLITIGSYAFSENEIISVTIPRNVEEISYRAFYRNNINELIFELGSKLRMVGMYSFYGNNISSLTLPDSLNYIDGGAFYGNNISNELTIPDSVEYIGWSAFSGNQIPEVHFSEYSLLSHLGESAFANNLISNDIFIPYTLTEISSYAFRNNNISKITTHPGIVEYGTGAFLYNNPDLEIVLHKPPTIEYVTYFFWWKDNYGNYYDPGEVISYSADPMNFSNRYKAVIDQFFVVKFIVTDDNNVPLENASIDIFGSTLSTDVNGIDSLGPVLRGFQNYEVTGITGCYDFKGTIDVQDDMTVYVTLERYYNVKVKVIDTNGDPIPNANIHINDSILLTDLNGNSALSLSDGTFPMAVNAPGYQEHSSSIPVLDGDVEISITLGPVLVNYFPNEGNEDAYTDVSAGSAYVVHNNSYTRAAYTFSHWNTSSDDSGTSYAENEAITLGFTDIDLYAIWTPVDYTITYHLDGGINDGNNPVTYNVESDITLLPATKTALYFATWLGADSNRVEKIEPGTIGDIELWAVFTPEPTYYIDYHNIENASHNNQLTYTQFDLPLIFTEAQKRGYEFIAWYEDAMFAKEISTVPVGSEKDYDIYARWGGAINYAINYIIDGGNNDPANPVQYTIESNDIVFAPPTKTGANFISWYNNISLTNEITQISQGSIGDTTIYAKWELDTFDIQYELNGGINDVSNPNNYTIDSENILFAPPTKTGASFISWYSDDGFINEITEITKGSLGDTTLYAKWEFNNYNIEYILDGGNNDPANPAQYTIESNDIVFAPPTKTGANFISWYNNISLTNEITQISQGSIGDTTIYAKWELDTFDIQYELNGGINDVSNPNHYTIDSDNILFAPPTKTGASFIAWYSDDGFINEITEITKGSLGDTTLYAKWEFNNYNIEYIMDGGNNDPANPAQYTIESDDIIFAPPTKTGAIFISWYNNISLTNEITQISQGSIGDTTIYAKWELDTFDIQYELNGGINNIANPTQYTIESNTIELEDPERNDYVFDGWFINPDYSNGINSIPKGSMGHITVHAKWIELFDVSFNITTDGINPAKDVDIIIDNNQKMISDDFGLSDTTVADGSSFEYSIEIGGIVIENGFVNVLGSDITIRVEIVNCYMRWYDVIFCDNGKGLWDSFVWGKDNMSGISQEQFYHKPGGIEDGKYRLVLTSIAGVEYIWEKEYKTDIFTINAFPNPVEKSGKLKIYLSGNIDMQNSSIFIYSMNGALVEKIDNPLFENEINIDDRFSSGFYNVVFRDRKNKRQTVSKFNVK